MGLNLMRRAGTVAATIGVVLVAGCGEQQSPSSDVAGATAITQAATTTAPATPATTSTPDATRGPATASSASTNAKSITRARAIRTARKAAGGGRATDIERDDEDGRPVWEIEIQRSGIKHKITISARNGRVLEHERDRDNDRDDDDDRDDSD